MNISPNGLKLIASFEGLRTHAYRDGGGVLTIGYGHTGPDVFEGQQITEDRAMELLKEDAGKAVDCVNLHTHDLTQNQFDALCSFTFNLGCGALQQMLAHGIDQVPAQMLRWKRIAGVESEGLFRRRTAEAALFVTSEA